MTFLRNVGTITWLTFQEAWRRWMVVAAVLLGLAFVLLYAWGFSVVDSDIHSRPLPGPFRAIPGLFYQAAYNFFLLAGLYVVHFLAVMLAIFASVDSVSGEITSHTIQ